MPDDRSSRPTGGSGRSRPSQGRSKGSNSKGAKSKGAKGGATGKGAYGSTSRKKPTSKGKGSFGAKADKDRGRGSSTRSDRSGSSQRRDESRGRQDRPPLTEAERRAAEVRARRGPRSPRSEEDERSKIESRSTDEWVDEGSVRAEAAAATRRAGGGGRSSARVRDAEIDPEVVAEIQAALSPERAKRLAERLASASAALDRERFDEAKRMITPLARELPHVAAVHEVSGLASYGLGRWRDAATSLELARQLHRDPALLPALADCYRALRRWHDVDEVWDEIKSTSPPHDVMAEGRIVVASSLAERGDLKAAISMMASAAQPPKRVRQHHLRQWYVLADLYDRAGDPLAATRWFSEIESREPDFADVRDRLRALGR